MNQLLAQFRGVMWWLVPLAVLLVVVGWEIDWGAAVRKGPPAEATIAPKPVAASLLPDYVIEGGLAARTETVNRTLFNPTRRPAPAAAAVALAEAAKPQMMQRGLYLLTGTALAGNQALAFLKESKGGKPRTVKLGDTIDGVRVAEVKADRVTLVMGGETEELVLKVVTNPKPTPIPPPPRPAPAAGGAQPRSPTRAPAAAAISQNPGQTLAERRRAARAAAAAAAAAGAGAATRSAPTTTESRPAAATSENAGASQVDPRWQQMDERYRRRNAERRK